MQKIVAPVLTDPANFRKEPSDLELFRRELGEFVPPNSFDAHAHLYDYGRLGMVGQDSESYPAGFDLYHRQQRHWMADSAPARGLFFPFPSRTLDVAAANDFLHRELQAQPASRGLMMITPQDDAAVV